jgi:hypothetical protein
MRYALVFVLGLAIAAGVGAAAGSDSKAQMRTLYEENMRLKEECAQLDKTLADLTFQIELTKKAVANLEYVQAENEKFMQTELGKTEQAK